MAARSTAIGALCFALFIAHAVLAWSNKAARGEMTALLAPPSPSAARALSFGDNEFLYRLFALHLQMAGDGGGRLTPIRSYNFDHVAAWLSLLAEIEPRSQHHFVLALRYFAFTPNPVHLRQLFDVVVAEASKDPEARWYWLTQVVMKAEHDMGDLPYALAVAQRLASYDIPSIPVWVKLFPAVILEKMGRYDEALAVLLGVGSTDSRLTPEDRNWMDEVSLRLKTARRKDEE